MAANGENRLMRRRLANAYLSSVISISLVLLLVGVASLLLVNAKSVSDYFKENMQVSVMMKQSVSDDQALAFRKELEGERYIMPIRDQPFTAKPSGMPPILPINNPTGIMRQRPIPEQQNKAIGYLPIQKR